MKTKNEFYAGIRDKVLSIDQTTKLCYITSRSTEENVSTIENVCAVIEREVKEYGISIENAQPTEQNLIDLRIEVLEYLILNTNFSCQEELLTDKVCHMKDDFQPVFSPYLLLEIVWRLHFEDTLAHLIFYFPLDLSVCIIEIIPRCIDLLNFERALPFLSKLITNVHKQLNSLQLASSQSEDLNKNTKKLAGNLQELTLQFSNERFLKMEDVPKEKKYQRFGTSFKKIIQTVKACFLRVFESPHRSNPSSLTFRRYDSERVEEDLLSELLKEIDNHLISLLMKEVKKVDCNAYLSWAEFEDDENNLLTLQRGIGLECYYFIHGTKECAAASSPDYEHLLECLGQLASKPESPDEKTLHDLCEEALRGNKDSLLTLFRRYKNWDGSEAAVIAISSVQLNKDECEQLLEHIGPEFAQANAHIQLYISRLSSFLFRLPVVELFELTIWFILKFSGESRTKAVDTSKLQEFLKSNKSLAWESTLKMVLFYLCLEPKQTLKVLLQSPVKPDDLMILLPVMKIRVPSSYEALMNKMAPRPPEDELDACVYKPGTVSLVIAALQEWMLEGFHKFVDRGLLALLKPRCCEAAELLAELAIPALLAGDALHRHHPYALQIAESCLAEVDHNLDVRFDLGRALVAFVNRTTKMRDTRWTNSRALALLCELEVTHVDCRRLRIFVQPNLHRAAGLCCAYLRDRLTIALNRYPAELLLDDIMRFCLLGCSLQHYLAFGAECAGPVALDRLVRLTLEGCLLLLEGPALQAPDNPDFMIHCLHQLAATCQGQQLDCLRRSLSRHLPMLQPALEGSELMRPLARALQQCRQEYADARLLAETLAKLQMAMGVMRDRLAQREPSVRARKYWLAYRLVAASLSGKPSGEEQIETFDERVGDQGPIYSCTRLSTECGKDPPPPDFVIKQPVPRIALYTRPKFRQIRKYLQI